MFSSLPGAFFDCITMYVNNILMEHLANKDNETLGINDLTALQTLLEKDLELLFNIISQTDNKEIIFVSDELGMGIVPLSLQIKQVLCRIFTARQYNKIRTPNQISLLNKTHVYIRFMGKCSKRYSRGWNLRRLSDAWRKGL